MSSVTNTQSLGVGLVGIGWCAAQHIQAFQKNPHTRVVALCGRNPQGVEANLTKYGVSAPGARITTRYEDLLEADDVQIVSIATPNNLHAAQAIAAVEAGKHILLEKPTALHLDELARLSAAVRRAGVRSIVSFELRYNPYLRFVHWLRSSGRLGPVRFARAQYLSRVLDWYAGWDWCRTNEGGGGHLLAAGCHAVDAMRWLSGLEPLDVSAFHTRFTAGYEWPTSILVNLRLEAGALGHVTSSTDFMLPYTFGVELMGDRLSVRDTLIGWKDEPVDLEELRAANPVPEVTLHPARYGSAAEAIQIACDNMPDSVDVAHHPFQAEIDDLVACIREGRDPELNVLDAEKTMQICLAADRSAAEGGTVVELPLRV
jgi:predicted dehydrogenase